MATKVEPEYPSSPNEESDEEEEKPQPKGPVVAKNVTELLKRLPSAQAILKTLKKEFPCKTCNKDFLTRDAQLEHLLQHVSLPSLILEKLPSDDEDGAPSGDDWSDEEEEDIPAPQKTPQKIDISQIMKRTGISIKNSSSPEKSNTDSALSKLTGLGFTIKKSLTPIKEEKSDIDESDSLMQKLGKLGGIKLKLKSEAGKNNSFQVVNGLKDFKTSDDEEGDNDAKGDESEDEDIEKEEKMETEDWDDAEAGDSKHSEEDMEIDHTLTNVTQKITAKQNVNKTVNPQILKSAQASVSPQNVTKPSGRPAVKQTPRRGPLLRTYSKIDNEAQSENIASTPVLDKSESHESDTQKVSVKQEVDADVETSSGVPLFSGQIKTERASPPIETNSSATPIIAQVKTEKDAILSEDRISTQNNETLPVLAVPKKEETDVTVIEINGDSDGDDDCCVVSATPAPDIKPIVPKTEEVGSSYTLPSLSAAQSTYTASPVLTSRLTENTTEKQHNFNWNAPDSKPAIDMLAKSTDDMFDSLFPKRDNLCLSDASEYISLDTLGPQHSCDVCNTRFTSLSLLDEHKRTTGHSNYIMPVSSSTTLLPYNQSSSILSSLLPVKQLAEQVGKLSGMGSNGAGFTHQQNVMINIQAYPGAGNMPPPPSYGSYGTGQSIHSGYQQQPNNFYMSGQGMPGQPMSGQMPGQYPNQNTMGQQGYGQQYGRVYGQQSMPKTGFMDSTSPYSAASPLQNMQQQPMYGQAPTLGNEMLGQMGPPSLPYVPASSPSKPPGSNNIKIQNVQTFAAGQLIGNPIQSQSGDMATGQGSAGQLVSGSTGPGTLRAPGQMPTGPIRMAVGANITGARPRMPSIRGIRPTVRPGVQLHGQVRGAKPRMPMKRPQGAMASPGLKRRSDMLLPGKHDNEDCQVMAMQKQRQGMPMIESVKGAKDKLNLGSQISITKKPAVNKEANAMANVLASRGISVKQKQKSRSPSPERPIPHIPNLGAGVSIKHSSKSSNFSIPEAKVGGGMQACKICKKMFLNSSSLAVHMNNAHPQANKSLFKCDECPASYAKSLQLDHHRRVFHNVSGPNRELGLPVVDLSQESTIQRLSNIGIYSFIPLANREQRDGGSFGIPVLSVHNMQNGMTRSLQGLGADGLLSLGPLKTLPNT